MEPISEHKEFIFSNSIHVPSLYSLYEDDYKYMEEVFRLTLQDLHAECKNHLNHYQSTDIPAIRRIVHKLKPSFGFVGMPELQEYCQSFENQCGQQPYPGDFDSDFKKWQEAVGNAISILELELDRLTNYNKSDS